MIPLDIKVFRLKVKVTFNGQDQEMIPLDIKVFRLKVKVTFNTK